MGEVKRGFSGRHDGDGVRVPRGFDLSSWVAGANKRAAQRRADKIWERIRRLMAALGCSSETADRMLSETDNPDRLVHRAEYGLVKNPEDENA
jgi:hypothetical protein